MRRAFTCAILALPILIVSTVADAQQGKNKQIKNQMSDEAIEARKECFAEAQARFPGTEYWLARASKPIARLPTGVVPSERAFDPKAASSNRTPAGAAISLRLEPRWFA